jgi:hypothetical protein
MSFWDTAYDVKAFTYLNAAKMTIARKVNPLCSDEKIGHYSPILTILKSRFIAIKRLRFWIEIKHDFIP